MPDGRIHRARALRRARDTMRKDKGLNGELDRLPTLAWLLLLRRLDASDDAPRLPAPYRWRDLVDGRRLTPDELLAFVAGDADVLRPDGTRGPGLLAYLRGPPGAGPARGPLGGAFAAAECRLRSGPVLCELVRQLDELPAATDDDVHALGELYESMLAEMRDAAGDSGEFYTPRPLTRTVVEMLDPRLGERVLDPACGTGGFLVDVVRHLELGGHSRRAIARGAPVTGWEAKTLPHLLARTNLVLHDQPRAEIVLRNSLEHPLDGGDAFDVVVTNPPFGGREEARVGDRFPPGRRTSETALLFLQIIRSRLGATGRAAVVLPDGCLFAGGPAARIRRDLLEACDVHTVLKLPRGTFAPYTSIPANVVFFGAGAPTREVWFYEHRARRGRYTKTAPLAYEDLAPFRAWYRDRAPGDRGWRVDVADIAADDHSLHRRNPRARTAPRAEDDPLAVVRELRRSGAELLGELRRIEARLEERAGARR